MNQLLILIFKRVIILLYFRIRMKLCEKAKNMADLLLKHYPLTAHNHSTTSESHTEHKKQTQHLHDYRKERQIYQKPTTQKLENMVFFKEEGNNHYKNQRYSDAMYFYQKVIIYGDYTFPEKQQEIQKMQLLLQQANSNLALCIIKNGKLKDAKINLLESTKGKNVNIQSKGYYWLSKYYLQEGNWIEALENINKLKILGQQYKKNTEELEIQLREKQRLELAKEKEVIGNIFK